MVAADITKTKREGADREQKGKELGLAGIAWTGPILNGQVQYPVTWTDLHL